MTTTSGEIILYDPTAEAAPAMRPRIGRPKSLDGLTVGLLDIAKQRGVEFLDRLDELLTERGHTVKRYRKERFSNVAAPELRERIAKECDVVVEALAD
jgi:hypothetical protein